VTTFSPCVSTSLLVLSNFYEFVHHPHFPDDDQEVFVIEGGEALLYQLRERMSGTLYALKVMKPAYRTEQCARVAAALASYKDIPGLFLSHRICFTKARCSDLIAAFPDLEYATLMPWLAGKTWAGLLLDQAASARYTRAKAYNLALVTANVLWQLEAHNLAHTDIAGGNVVISPNFKQVELLDVEGLYMPDTPIPTWRSQGSPGYQHRNPDQRGQWRPEGDRFAGAILLTEMLTWWNPLVRAQTPDEAESLFQPQELQTIDFPRWHAVRNTLWSMSPYLLQLFDQAWASPDLSQCPDFGSWAMCLFAAT